MENVQTNSLPTHEEVEKGITLKDIWYVIRKHIIAILVFLVLGAGGGFAYDRFQPVQYQTSATLMGNKGSTSSSTGGTYQDYYLADYVSQTLVDFVTQYRVIEETVTYLSNDPTDPILPGLGYGKDYITFNQLKSGITAKSSSLFVNVTFKMAVKNPNEAKFAKNEDGVIEYHMIVLNALCETLVRIANETKIVQKIDEKTKEPYYVEVAKYPFFNGNIDVMSTANNTVKVSQAAKRIAIGLAIGAVIAILYMVFRQILDNRFKDAEEVERILGTPVLASIPEYSLADLPEKNKFDPRNAASSNEANNESEDK